MSLRDVPTAVEEVYRSEWGRVVATLIGMLGGDFDLAEETAQEAFAAAVTQWEKDGVPEYPRAWIISTARHKAIDRIRRKAKFEEELEPRLEQGTLDVATPPQEYTAEIPDDRLRLIFTCCHPALALDAQIALTLRTLCGLETEEIARAFLVPVPTMAQRVVRAKSKIRDAGIPYAVPETSQMAERLDAVLHVIYLVFNEGYSASSGESLTRADLSEEAIRLARIVVELLPDPEALGLLSLMLLHESRRAARTSEDGDMILLNDQDRTLWDRALIAEGTALVERSFALRRPGPYSIQAAIAAVHADSPTPDATDWRQIVALYDLLLQVVASPVIELNRAVAVAMRDGAPAGLAVIDTILARGDLANYHLAYSARADMLRRIGKKSEARKAYERALALTQQAPEQRFLRKRIAEVSG
ncbi:RNA polymerase, sigma subunit, ECF family [Candidatus Koribacter versatilis Ellin345]|uniref:RNA polymerase, sigma subunit, ECF family n=1 Tax=Koribacter versatilis (strain Ellin345) TaxID=204669 RepID=Q1II47_KORVE|nr:RNA polymerase sigma factor [Candidatus Koribacter versatilis]ABF43453.1 RNA polymerase, sigma subunit, ECF family [Candidatus Koribacter versatilis Ellin345]